MADTDLVTLAQRGDMQALGTLYDQHHEALFRYVWARVGEQQVAEDLTGDVFMRMLTALPRYQPSGAPFRAWLYRIAHNLLVDHFRKSSYRATAPLYEADDRGEPESDPTFAVEQKLSAERLHRVLAMLDEAQRDVVTLRFLSGLSLDETAAVLEKTEAAVKALQHRGLAALRRALTEEQVNHE